VVTFDVAAELVIAVKALGLFMAKRAEGGLTLRLAGWLARDFRLVSYGAIFGSDRNGFRFRWLV
jgi:hypothetical protein